MLLEEQELNHSGGSDLEDHFEDLSSSESPVGPMLQHNLSASTGVLPQAHDYSQVISLLQQQQTVLQQVLSGQRSLEKRQDCLRYCVFNQISMHFVNPLSLPVAIRGVIRNESVWLLVICL